MTFQPFQPFPPILPLMFRTIDRYVLRELLLPFALSLAVLTFILVIPPILRDAEDLIVKGIAWTTFLHVLVLLLPQALSLTIPMSVLLGILIGFGRLSGDREFVAMQACGVSPFRLIRPVALFAVLATLATAHQIIVALPEANQTFREITFNVVANRAESNVKPRVFYGEFPSRTIYARDVVAGGWREVFLADTSQPGQTTVYFAKEGRLRVDREKKLVALELTAGTWHTTSVTKPDEYEGGNYDSTIIHLDPATVFPSIAPPKTEREMSIAELKASIVAGHARGDPSLSQQYMIQQKFSIPAASLVLALIGLALGISHRKDGRFSSFVLGFGVIFAYYVVLWTVRAGALTGQLPAGPAAWIPNTIFGVAGVALLFWRAGSPDQRIRISLPSYRPASSKVVLVIRIPHINLAWLARLPRPGLLDLYVSGQYLRVFFLGLFSLLGIFYISTFMDLADKLFRGTATSAMMLRYFFFQTPQFVYYVIPMAVLVATLVTVGLMTKNSELVVMRACGISLYPYRGAPDAVRRGGERGPVRPPGTGHGVFEPRGRSPEPPHPRAAAAKLRGARSAMDGGAERRYLSLRGVRRQPEPVPPVRHISPRPGALGPAVSYQREPGRADAAGTHGRFRRQRGVGGLDRLVARVLRDDRAKRHEDRGQVRPVLPADLAARASRLLQD